MYIYRFWVRPTNVNIESFEFNEQVEVKVKENWRQDEGLLQRYGYGGKIQVL